ncbi:MAG: insulinase family protein [Acidobacteriia bacterium]|nr:insulinase family protein [Terriglobia bacterium]
MRPYPLRQRTSARPGRGGWGWRVVCVLLLAASAALAREYPPTAPPPKPLVLPEAVIHELPNGLKVLVIERHRLPLVTLRFVVRAGTEADPPSLPGTGQLVNALLTEGTTHRSALDIGEAIDSIGGMVDNGATWDHSYLTLSVLSDHEDRAFDLVADVIAHPAFAHSEIERQRKQLLSAIEVERDDPSYVANTAFQGVIFAGTPYSHPEDGTLESVRRIREEDLRAYHAQYYRPANCILAVVGDIAAGEAFTQAERFFGDWANGPVPAAQPQTTPSATARRVVAIDKPDAVQTEIRIGNLAPARNSPDYDALSIANQVLGGPAANRLFRALRTRQGLTYGASSDLVCYRRFGDWEAKTFTRTAETVKSLDISLDLIKQMREHRISELELETAQGYLIGHMALDFETSEDLAARFLELLIDDLPLDTWNHFPDHIRALTADEVWDVTRRYLDPDHNVIVLVGNVAGLQKDLRKLGQVEIIPLSDVDFASPNLARPSSEAGKP